MVTKLLNILNPSDFTSIDLEHFYSEIKNSNYKKEIDYYFDNHIFL